MNDNKKPALRYDITYQGPVKRGDFACDTWRIELLDEKNQPTDIWSECRLDNNKWICSYEGAVFDTLIEALQHGLRSLLEYSGFNE